jgi:hypothetical protein
VFAAAVPLVLLPALALAQGGFEPDAWVWAGALAAWAAAVAVVVTAAPGALRRAWPWVAASGALLVWTLLSRIWSARPAQSLLEARRTLVYAAVVLALVLLVRRGGTRVLVLATAVAIAAVDLYALGRYLLGARRYDEFEGFLLSEPLGYANAVGIVTALGIVLALGIAVGEDSRRRRAAAAAVVPPLALALLFTGSTASWLALGIGVAVAALLDPAPLRLLATLAAVAPPAALAGAVGYASRFADDTVATPHIRGSLVAAAAVACALAAGGAVALLPRLDGRARLARRVVAAAVICVALAAAAAVARSGSTEPRASFWHVAWHDEYRAHPVLGTGAGTFGFYWARSGRVVDVGGALDAHSLYLETLAELGPVGLLLLAGMLLAPLRGVRGSGSVPYVPAAVGAYAAFLVHAGLDWDWEMPVVIVAGLCCGAAAIAAAPGPQRPLGRTARAALLLAAFALAGCAIAGARSHTVPEAAAQRTERAPLSEALSPQHA